MMFKKNIDLRDLPKGATLWVEFDYRGRDPFLVLVTGPDEKMTYYYRVIDQPSVSINLPVHPRIIVLASTYPVKSILKGPLKIYPIKYNFNTEIITPRSYPFHAIRTEILPFIPDEYGNPSDQPARFAPEEGLRQISASVFQNLPQPVAKFVLEHENGHYFYGRDLPNRDYWGFFPQDQQKNIERMFIQDEKEADRYAAYKLINDGYNFSGALGSLADFLSNNYISQERINDLFEILDREHKNPENAWTRKAA